MLNPFGWGGGWGWVCRGKEWKELKAELNKAVSRQKVEPFSGYQFGFGFRFGFSDLGFGGSGIGTLLYKVGGLSPNRSLAPWAKLAGWTPFGRLLRIPMVETYRVGGFTRILMCRNLKCEGGFRGNAGEGHAREGDQWD